MYLLNQFGEQAVNFARPAPGQTNPCIFGGEGVPDMVAPENSLYFQLDASSSDAYLYRNTDGDDTWEALILGEAGVLATPLTGLAAGSNTPIAASDTILEALANLQAQIDAL